MREKLNPLFAAEANLETVSEYEIVYVLYKTEDKEPVFYGVYENETDAKNEMNAILERGGECEMEKCVLDYKTCPNAYPNVDTVYVEYNWSDFHNRIDICTIYASSSDLGISIIEENIKSKNELAKDCSFPALKNFKLKYTDADFFPAEKDQAENKKSLS